MAGLKVFHEGGQPFCAGERHSGDDGIADGRRDGAAVRSEVGHAGEVGLHHELLLEVSPRQHEARVYGGPLGRILDGAGVEPPALVDGSVDNLGPLSVPPLRLFQAALLQQILEDQRAQVDSGTRRRVTNAGGAADVRGEVDHRRRPRLRLPDKVPSHDGHREPPRCRVTLRAGVDQTEPGHVNRSRAEAGRHVSHENSAVLRGEGKRGVVEAEALEGLVSAEVDELGGRVEAELGRRGEAGEVDGLPGPGYCCPAAPGGGRESFIAPGAGDDVVGGVEGGCAEVERHRWEEGGDVAGEEEDCVLLRDMEEQAERRLRSGDSGGEVSLPASHFLFRGGGAAAVVEEFGPGLAGDALGEGTWGGREAEQAVV